MSINQLSIFSQLTQIPFVYCYITMMIEYEVPSCKHSHNEDLVLLNTSQKYILLLLGSLFFAYRFEGKLLA